MKNPGILSQERFDIFKEDVKSVIHLSYEVKEGSRVLKSHVKKQYNIKGQVLKSEEFELDDSGKLNPNFEMLILMSYICDYMWKYLVYQ